MSESDSFAIFVYDDIQWTNSKPMAGINAGNRVTHITLPGSRTSHISHIQNTSNVGVPGMWIFKFDGKGTILQL